MCTFSYWRNFVSVYHTTVRRPQLLQASFDCSSVFAQTVPGTGAGTGTSTGKDSQAFFNSSLLCATLPNGSSGSLIRKGCICICCCGSGCGCLQLLLPLENWFPGESRQRNGGGANSDSTLCPILSIFGRVVIPRKVWSPWHRWKRGGVSLNKGCQKHYTATKARFLCVSSAFLTRLRSCDANIYQN